MSLPVSPTSILLVAALAILTVLVKIAVDIGEVKGRLKDKEAVREFVRELSSGSGAGR